MLRMLHAFALILAFSFGLFPQPAQNNATAVDGKTLAAYEEILHRILTYEEYAEERKQLCGMTVEFRDSETDLLLFTRCPVNGENFSFRYEAKGLVLSVVLQDGSVIADQGEDGEIDVFPKGKTKAEWQQTFADRILSVFKKNPSLSRLGSSFIYAISSEYGHRW